MPTIYYGDEQGFLGDGNDQDAREDMFASRVAVYNDNDLIASNATTAQPNFGTDHPLYKLIGELSAMRKESAALRMEPRRSMRSMRAIRSEWMKSWRSAATARGRTGSAGTSRGRRIMRRAGRPV